MKVPEEIEGVEEERSPKVTKEVIEKCFEEFEHSLMEGIEMTDELEKKVRTGVLDALKMLEDEDEGYATEKSEDLGETQDSKPCSPFMLKP